MTSRPPWDATRRQQRVQNPRSLQILGPLAPVVVIGLLLFIPGVREVARDRPVLVTVVLIVAISATIAAVAVSKKRRNTRIDGGLDRSRGGWAASRGWRYAPGPRFIDPDALTEVDSRRQPKPLVVKFEATGTHQGRPAFVHTRDTWVRVRVSVTTARREVVGIESRIELPRLVIEGGARTGGLIPERTERAAQRRAEGLVQFSGPPGSGTVLWTPPGLEHQLLAVLDPVLGSIRQALGEQQAILACAGRVVLLSLDGDHEGHRVEERLAYAGWIADVLERGAQPQR